MSEIGCVVISAAGKDRDGWMVVVRLDDDSIWVADGRYRRLEAPKRKNPRHLRLTPYRVEALDMATNRGLRRALAAFREAAPIEYGRLSVSGTDH